MSADSIARPGATPRTLSRRGLLRSAGLLGAGVAGWAALGAVGPSTARAAGSRKIVWSKDAVRVYLVEDGRIVRTMPCVQNRSKTPNGTYTIWSYERALSYYQGRQVDLPEFAPFYRRPGASWNIGFHAIPVWSDGPDKGKQIHEDAVLGTDLESEGCVRLAAADASFLRTWAPVGTSVVVQDAAYVQEALPVTASPTPSTLTAPAASAGAAGDPTAGSGDPATAPPGVSAPESCQPHRRWFWPWGGNDC